MMPKKVYRIKFFENGEWKLAMGDYKTLIDAAERARENKATPQVVVRIETSEFVEAYFPQPS